MPIKKDKPLILLISKYIDRIIEFTDGLTLEEFSESQITYDACVLNLLNIGETLKKVSKGLKNKYPNIEYKKIIGLRNIIAHHYEAIEPYRVFN